MQPPVYNRQFSFTTFSASSPTVPPPGVELDAEFNGIKSTLDVTLANLRLIQRDDGHLHNETVGINQFDDTGLALIGSPGFIVRGRWSPGTYYRAGDVFTDAGNNLFLAMADHTAFTLMAVDIVAGRVFGPMLGGAGGGAGLESGFAFTCADISTKPPNAIIGRYSVGIPLLLPSGLPNAHGRVVTPPNATTDIALAMDGVIKGNARWVQGAFEPVFFWASDLTAMRDDYFDIISPGSWNGMSGAWGMTIMGVKA